MRRRLDAAIGALAEAGIEASSVLLYEPEHNVPSEGERAATWLLGQSPRPTALMCQSDQLAIGALTAASRLGIEVPGEVSIAGFDDIDAAADTNPPLTTVRQPLRERGRRAGELVLELLAGGRPRQVRLPTELVVRRSTGTGHAASTALIAQAVPLVGVLDGELQPPAVLAASPPAPTTTSASRRPRRRVGRAEPASHR